MALPSRLSRFNTTGNKARKKKHPIYSARVGEAGRDADDLGGLSKPLQPDQFILLFQYVHLNITATYF